MQNGHKDPTTRIFAKAYAFVMGADIEFPSKDYSNVPFMTKLLTVLRVGAMQYRYDYMKTHDGDLILHEGGYRNAEPTEIYVLKRYDKNLPGFTILSEGEYGKINNPTMKIDSAFAKSAKKVFENWVKGNNGNGTFTKINNYLEIYGTGENNNNTDAKALDGKTFVEYLAEKSNQKNYLFWTVTKLAPTKPVYTKEYNIDTTVGAIKNLKIDFGEETGELKSLLIDTYGDRAAVNTSFEQRLRDNVSNNVLQAYNDFIKELGKLYDNMGTVEGSYQPLTDTEMLDDNKDIKLSIYMTLRNLYDRWFANGKPQNWMLDEPNSDFNTFKFVNSVFENTYNLMTNVDNVSNLVTAYAAISSNLEKEPTKNFLSNNSKSIYEFLAHVAQDTGGILMAIPVAGSRDIMDTNEVFTKNIASMFTPYTYNSSPIPANTTYLFLYPQKPSEHLAYDNDKDDNYQYVDDGIDLANTWGTVIESPIFVNQSNSFNVPGFGVSYGRQNQSIFKDITLNMDVPQVTEASIAATFNIASRSGVGPREQVLYGQDLYKVFSNYSYNCTVEMMGDMQIMPLMYFQLNNIPLFKGAYQIIKVEHSFTPGNATTKFVGVRVSRYQIPAVKIPYFTGDNTAFRGNQYTIGGYLTPDNWKPANASGIGKIRNGGTELSYPWKTYGYIASDASVGLIKRMYNEIKEGLYDGVPDSSRRQVLTIEGKKGYNLCIGKGYVQQRSDNPEYWDNLVLLRDTTQPILDA